MNKYNTILKFLILFLSFPFIASGQSQESDTVSNESNKAWRFFNGSNYLISYPSEWELDLSGQMGTALIIFSPLETSQDQFKENVNLIIQDLSGHNINLDKYAEISEGQIKMMITNSTLIESKKVEDGSGEYHRMIYTGDQGIFHLKFIQYYWIKNEKAFVLTLTCEADKYLEYNKIGEGILNSFKLKN